ncbi:MAG TPA: nuclear transport factor 2 family protein, partial [Acidimicrobiia bacterium]|nr:nuclear transport factor 2 family protein [Acidimicrobiia bacterium]
MAAPAPSAAAPSSATITNAAWERVDGFWDLFLEGRLDECEAMLSPALVQEDRRGHVQAQLTRADWLDNLRVLSTLGVTRIERHPIAVRADNLVVTSTTFSGDFESTLVSVSRDDADGRVSLIVTFDEDDIGSALTLLDELYEAELPDEQARDLRDVRISANAHATRDWATFRASLADDVRMVDHRPRASAGEIIGREPFAEYAQAMIDVAPDYLLVTRRLLGNANRCILGEVASVSRSGGARYEEQRFLLTRTNAAGEVDRFESYAPEQADQAWARFRELSGEVEALTNTASAAYGSVNRALLGLRPDEAATYLAPDVVRDDRRSGIKYVLSGVAETTEHLRAVVEMGNDRMAERVLSVRDDHLALVETGWGGQFDTSLLTVVRTNSDGLIDLAVNFEVEDLSAALDELDLLFLAGLDDARARSLRAGRALLEAHNRRDWDAVRNLVTADVQIVDHRPAGAAPIVGGDAFVEYAKAMVDLAPEYVLLVRQVLAISGRSILGDYVSRHTGAADSSYETSRILLTTFDAVGRGTRRESFGPDQLDLAWARYRELSADDNPRMAEYRRGFELALAGRTHELAALIAPDYEFIDRREGMAGEIRGGEAGLEHLLSLTQRGMTSFDLDEIATRGKQLALLRATFYANDFTIEIVWIHREDELGRSTRTVVFDPTDLRSALEELDELYAAELPPAEASDLRNAWVVLGAHNRRDWVAFREGVADEVRVVDHRPGMSGETIGGDQLTEYSKAMVDVAPDYMLVTRRILAIANHCILGENISVVTGSTGGHYEEPRLLVTRTDAEGKLDLRESYGPEQLDQAWARFQELSADEHPKMAEYRRAFELATAGRFDELGQWLSPDYVYDDRREGLGNVIRGRASGVEHFRAIAAVSPTRLDIEELATRGERLALLRRRIHADELYADMLWIHSTDEHGLHNLAMAFDPTDVSAAFKELDELYVAGEGARFAAQLGYVRDFMRRYNALDFDGLRGFYAADVVSIDRRPAGFGTQHGVDEVIARHRALGDMAPDATLVVPHIYEMGERFWLAELRTLLPVPEGQGYELHSFVVEEVVAPAGPISRIEYFATLDEARSRYDELAATTGEPTWANAAYRAAETIRRAVLAGRVEELAAIVSPSMITEDRRAGLSSRLEGFEQIRALANLGVTSIESELLAVRGERLALTSTVWRGDFEVHVLTVVCLDEAGLLCRSALYDPDQLEAAVDDLYELYLAGEGAPYAQTLRTLDRAAKAFDDHRWDDLRPLYADDLVSVDHEPTGFGEMHGADALLDRHRVAVELAPDYRLLWTRVLAMDELGSLSESTAISTTTSGGAYTRPRLFITRVQTPSGPIVRFEQFGPDQLELAWVRYRELSGGAGTGDNAAMKM